MANWRDSILKEFKRDISRLTLVSDPDGLLTEERTLATIKERGFDLIPFEDSIAFRYAYESKYRTIWDEGKKTDLVVVLRSEHDLDSLPYDLLCAGRRLEFSLHKLFPNLTYPVLQALDASHLDAVHDAYHRQHEPHLPENATKEFVLTHCFRIVPGLISTPVELVRMLLSRHYHGEPIPELLDTYLLHNLRSKQQLAAWPLEEILSNGEALLQFLQDQWTLYLHSLLNGGEGCVVPFDDQDVKAYVDTLFLEGLLKPVPVEEAAQIPGWVGVGIQRDPQAEAVSRFGKLVERCKNVLPNDDAPHRDWQKLARAWAESVVLRWELDSKLDAPRKKAWEQLHEAIEERFGDWMLNRYGSLHNLPTTPQPVMVHHVARYLAAERAKRSVGKLALVVVDGLALDQWLVLRRCLEAKKLGWRLEESIVFAWVPTLTSVSRQSIFAAEPPLYFPESFNTTDRESTHWTRFWEDRGASRDSVEYVKMVESGDSEALDKCLGNPHLAVVGIVVNTVDKIMHGEHQGTAGMHDAVRLWAGKAISLFQRLLDEGAEVYLTADHGNIAGEGVGIPREGVLVEVGGKRARIYDSPTLRAEVESEYPESIAWPNIGLPPEQNALLPKGLRAFAPSGKHVVSHGGVALEEVVVPFVRIVRDEE